jgi:uncharacterized protein YndB with AHSA1/START domain
MPTHPSLTLRRRLSAPPAKVYAAWTDPQKVKRWWSPLENDEALHVETDVRVGGRFRIVMRGSGGERHDVCGVYREVVPDEKLVFTWAWHTTPERESLVTVSFESDGDGTVLRLTHERFFDEAARDGHLEGWGNLLDKLERQLV